MREKLYLLIDIFFHILKPSNNKILFSSFHGQYNDNPKYISEKIHTLYPEKELYWVLSEKSKFNDVPSYVKVLYYNTLKYCWIKNRCRIIVENGAGYYLFDNSGKLFNLKKKLKNKKQLDLSTWHGNPLKSIGAQIPGNEFWREETMFTTSDVLLAGSEMVKSIFQKAFLNKMPIELLGTPRTDILFKKDEKFKEQLKRKLGFPEDKKIVLFAPTYRDNVQDSGVTQLEMIDFDILFSTLKKRFGGEWIFVFRVHNMVLLSINNSKLSEMYGERVVDGNKYDDMAEYLYICDIMMSDYSGCIFDIALTEKPCFLFAHDRERYEKEERGFYFPLSKFPYEFAESFEDLVQNIQSYDEKKTCEKRKSFLEYVGNIEDGKAASRVVDYIFSKT